jgi:hypothetical protein
MNKDIEYKMCFLPKGSYAYQLYQEQKFEELDALLEKLHKDWNYVNTRAGMEHLYQ